MGHQRGSNSAGVNGLLDITGVGKQFHVLVDGWDKSGSVSRKSRVGRGNAGFDDSRPILEGQKLTIHGKTNMDGFPEPSSLRNANGTITLTHHTVSGTPYQASYPVQIDGDSIKFKDKTKDNWDISVACHVTAAPTYTGWSGTQPTPTAPTYSDKELYAGTAKTRDANFLATAAQRRTDAVGVADNDSAEATKLSTMAGAASAPITNLKLRTISFQRTDKDGGDVVEAWAPNDTKDEIEKPGTWNNLDPLEIDSSALDTDVYTTASGVPAAPSVPSGELQITSTKIEEINPIKSKRTVQMEVLNSEEKRTYPKITTTDDAENIEDEAVRAEFWDVGDTPPALPDDAPTNNVKLVNFTDVPITPAKNMRVWVYGPKNSDDKLVLPNYETVADASNLVATAVRAALDGDSISDPAGYVLRKTITRPVTLGLGVNRTLTIKEYGLRTTKQDIENPGTHTTIDPLGIESKALDTDVYLTTGGVPSAPVAPSAELQIVATKTEVINSLMSKREVEFDVLNSEEKRTYPKISTTDDANNIEDEAVRAEFWDVGDTPPALPTDTPANNVKLIDFVDVPVTPDKNMRVWVYGARDSADKLILPNYETIADANNLEASAVRAALDGTSISDPAGYTLRRTITKPVTLSLGTNRTLTIKVYGLRTTASDITMPATWTKIDPQGLETFGKNTQVYTTLSGVPSDPSPPSGTQITASRIEVLNDLKSKKEWEFEINNSEQKITFARSRSSRSALEPYQDIVCGVVNDSTSDLTSLANTLWATYASTALLVRLEVSRLTPAKIQILWFYSNPGIMVEGVTFAPQRLSPFRINGSTPQVYIAQVRDINGTEKCMLHRSQILITTPIREFEVSRVLSGTTIPDQESHVGKVNSTSFLGIGAGKVMYMGAKYRTRYDASGTRSFDMRYKFRADSNGFFNYVGVCDEWFVTDASASAGWVDASTFTGLITVTTPTGADFATIFLA